MFKLTTITLTSTALSLVFAACQKAETPPEVREDIAQAQLQAEVDSAITVAEGEHGVAIERCEALIGDERDICKDEADRTLEAAKNAAQGTPGMPPSQ